MGGSVPFFLFFFIWFVLLFGFVFSSLAEQMPSVYAE